MDQNVSEVIEGFEVLKFYKTSITSILSFYIQRIYTLIFREKDFCKGFLRTFWGCPKMYSQKVRRKNAHGVNLLIFNVTILILLIRFLRIFRISRICPTPKFSKYSKDSNWLLITYNSSLIVHSCYFPDTTPIPLRKDTEGIQKGYRRVVKHIVEEVCQNVSLMSYMVFGTEFDT